MNLPNAFQPSRLVVKVEFDNEGRIRESRLGSLGEIGVGDTNSIYSTDAERFDAITPFLKKSKAKADAARGYTIQPGGACLYRGDKGREKVELPDPHTSFGHNDQRGTKLVDQRGRAFRLSRDGGG